MYRYIYANRKEKVIEKDVKKYRAKSKLTLILSCYTQREFKPNLHKFHMYRTSHNTMPIHTIPCRYIPYHALYEHTKSTDTKARRIRMYRGVFRRVAAVMALRCTYSASAPRAINVASLPLLPLYLHAAAGHHHCTRFTENLAIYQAFWLWIWCSDASLNRLSGGRQFVEMA